MAAAAGGRKHLVDLWATAPSAVNWQEPLGQDPIRPSSSGPSDPTYKMLFCGACVAVFVIVCCCVLRRCFRNKEHDEQDTIIFMRGPWSNDGDAEEVSAPPPPPLPLPLPVQDEQQPPEIWNGHAPQSNNSQVDRPPQRRRRRRRQQQPAVVEPVLPASDDVELATGDVELTLAGVDWPVQANMELLEAATVDMEMAPAADNEIAPAPTLKCTYSKADGWAEGTCSVCLSELVDGEKVRVLTACMHCFHARCVETWLRENATCPLCRAPAMAVPARGRRRRRQRQADPNMSLA